MDSVRRKLDVGHNRDNGRALLTDIRDTSSCDNGLEGRRKTHSWTVFFFSCSRYSNRHRGLKAASLNISKQALMEIKTHIEETSTVPKTKSFLLNLAYKKTFQDVTN